MHPVLLHLGPVTVYSYGTCVVLSLMVGVGALVLVTFRLKLSPLMLVVPGIAGPAFFIGSRLGYILTDPSVCSSTSILARRLFARLCNGVLPQASAAPGSAPWATSQRASSSGQLSKASADCFP